MNDIFNFDSTTDATPMNYNFEWMMYGSLLMLANVGNLVVYLIFFILVLINALIFNTLYYKYVPIKK